MKTAIIKILFLIAIMTVSVFSAGCCKIDKAINQNNKEANNTIPLASKQNNEIESVEDMVIEDKIKTPSSADAVEEEERQGEEDISDWLIYTNAKAKYKISYPKTYVVTEYKDNPEIVSLNFKDTSNMDYHGGEISIRTGDSANTADNFLAVIKENCEDEYGLCADIFEDKIIDLSNIKGVRKITYSREIGGYATSYFFTGKNGQVNFELSFNFEEDEVRGKIIDSFEFF